MTHSATNGGPEYFTDTEHVVDAWSKILEMDLTKDQLAEIYDYGAMRYAQGFANGRLFREWI